MAAEHSWTLDDFLWVEQEMRVLPHELPPPPAALAPALAPPHAAVADKPRRRSRFARFECQVPGCREGQDPVDAPPSRYSVRYRLCATHLYCVGLRLKPDGELLRHCQKCSVLHPVGAFEGAKRSCRQQLERQRARRAARNGGGGATADTPPSGGTPVRRSPETVSPAATSRLPRQASYGPASSTGGASGDDASAAAGPEYDGVADRAELAHLALWDPLTAALLAPLSTDLYATSAPPVPPVPSLTDCEEVLALAASWLQEDRQSALTAAAALCVDMRIKLPSAAPAALPNTLNAALTALLDPSAVGVHAAVCPGCTLITVGGVEASPRGRRGGRGAEPRSAAAVVRQLLSGPASRFFRAQPGFSVALAGGSDCAASERSGRVVAYVAPPAQRPPPLPLLPLAVCSAVEARLAVTLPAGCADAYRLRVRVHGQFLATARLERAPGGDATRHVIVLPRSAACGLALLELEPVAGGADETGGAEPAVSRAHWGGASAALVLTPDAAVAKELASEPMPATADAVAARDALAACMGHTLRGSANGSTAPPRLAHAAARAAIARGWLATVAAVLPGCPAGEGEEGVEEEEAGGGETDSDLAGVSSRRRGAPSLLHAALCSPSPQEAAQLVLSALRPAAAAADAAAAWGGDGVATPRLTPMHLAATVPQAASAAALLRMLAAQCPAAAAAWALEAPGGGPPAAALARGAHPASADIGALAAALREVGASAAHAVAVAVADARDAPQPRLRLRSLTPAAALDAAQEALELARDEPIAAALAARAAAAAAARARAAGWRMPGAFADPEMEAAWLRHVTHLMRFSDRFGYPFAALSHGAQLLSLYLRSGVLPTPLQLFYFLFMCLLTPSIIALAPAFFMRRREAVHAFMRLSGTLMLPAWVQRPGNHAALHISPVQQGMTLFGMAFFSLAAVVRAPLHMALQVTTFFISVGLFRIHALLRMRIVVACCNLLLVVIMERASRRRFRATWRAKANKKKD